MLPAIIWAAAILIITGIPGRSIPETDVLRIPGIDKAIHFIIYAVFGALLFHGLRRGKQSTGKRLAAASIATGIFYGALTEYIQHCCLTDRHGNCQDFIANAFGTVFGVLITGVVLKIKEENSKRKKGV